MSNGIYQADQLTVWSGEPPASPSVLPDSGTASTTQGAGLCLLSLKSLNVSGLDGLSGKMSPASCPATEEGTLAPSSGRWASWGMGGPTESWTLNGSEWPKDAVVCSLSDVLETQPVPQKFILSAKASSGILLRAERRGKALPPMLKKALEQVA